MKLRRSRPIKWHRIRKRVLWHHLPLGGGISALVALLYVAIPSSDVVFRLSMGTGYAGLGLLAGTMLLGPLNVLRNRPNPVSTDLRRDVGIWAALVSIIHTVVGWQVHFRGQAWKYFFEEPALWGFRLDLFGVANYTGSAAGVIALGLLGLSNDWALRTMGVKRWKALQRWNYGLFALVALHGVIYQILEARALAFVIVFAAVLLIVVTCQFVAFQRLRN